jgi:hypothetical protein
MGSKLYRSCEKEKSSGRMGDFKQILIRKVSVDLAVPENVVEKIIGWQFSSAVNAIKNNMTVELSGIGTFRLLESRWNKAMASYSQGVERLKKILEEEGDTLSPTRRKGVERKLKILEENIQMLKNKKHEN